MAPASVQALEIGALAKIMNELDYYQLLGIPPSASAAEVRKAFHASSRTFHPDANRELDPALRDQCVQISKRVTEAYCVLRDARRRQAYDARANSNQNLRIQLAEAKNAHSEQHKAERRGRTPQGRQFHARAEADLKRGNLAGAIQNIQMALTFEGNNAGLKSLLEELRARQKQSR
jgi:DnaJ-class molecular chaperone